MRYVFDGPGTGIVLMDLARGVTLDVGPGAYPFWSPDGKGIIYFDFRPRGVMRRDPDSPAPPTALAELRDRALSGGDISPDGKYVAVRDSRGLVAIPVDQNRPPPIIFGDGANPRFSPDGRYIAYVGVTKPGIYLEKFPERTFRTVVANAGSEIVWARDGKRLYYRSPQGRMVSVDIHESGNGISFGSAHEVFDSAAKDAVIGGLDVSPDGKRFLVLLGDESARAENELTVLLNWRDALKK
jgi:Tol biopolymer transport system component